jgi:hypothetical protein
VTIHDSTGKTPLPPRGIAYRNPKTTRIAYFTQQAICMSVRNPKQAVCLLTRFHEADGLNVQLTQIQQHGSRGPAHPHFTIYFHPLPPRKIPSPQVK